ncbi:hypothetical protein WJX72_006200 [[Myrmecia] bisecta]|uniref:Uncharacterized protein n=1 Tax=[Myrmecia] bisecta TaxID=41462 RepID=A0AAW1PQK7_9CHLO
MYSSMRGLGWKHRQSGGQVCNKPSQKYRVAVQVQKSEYEKLEKRKAALLERVAVEAALRIGLHGTLAVGIGYYAHLDPLGHFHLDSAALLVGCLAALPLMLVDTVKFLPDWAPPHTRQQRLPSSSAHSATDQRVARQAEGPDCQQAEDIYPLAAGSRASSSAQVQRVERWKTFRGAMYTLQLTSVMGNPRRHVPLTWEVPLRALSCLSEQMLYRAILLQGVSNWVEDRLFEAGIEDLVAYNWWSGGMSVAQCAGWCTLAAWLCGGVGMAARRLYDDEQALQASVQAVLAQMNAQQHKKAQRSSVTSLAPPPTSTFAMSLATSVDKQELHGVLLGRFQAASRASRYAMYFGTLHDAVEFAVLGGSYLLTGNLAPAVTSACLSEALLLYFQRTRAAKQQQRLESTLMKARTTLDQARKTAKDTARLVRETKQSVKDASKDTIN